MVQHFGGDEQTATQSAHQRCDCENLKCQRDHQPGNCLETATVRAAYGKLCAPCAVYMPDEYKGDDWEERRVAREAREPLLSHEIDLIEESDRDESEHTSCVSRSFASDDAHRRFHESERTASTPNAVGGKA